ncbi:hypothetical protein [Sabulicella glaciei]|uniref:Uncharacterized protein n=1 Tax=Sabulicella glaciei TaxID=2984948 RepID=A0ABT3NXM7_9PROT|nr:hypothetical protein [Roseococcus sp. MDT2-1-1]MCW8086927.1 hypothetical protein [Roseococcus sp. MDT2-1-1]
MGEASGGAIPPNAARLGAWERLEISREGLTLAGWARREDGTPPVAFELGWDRHRVQIQIPPQGPEAHGHAIGFQTHVGIPFDPHEDWSSAALSALWADGDRLLLPPTPALEEALFRFFRFEDFKSFQLLFQNPAFRVNDPLLQAHGAARALRIAGDDVEFRLAGTIVALYRAIEEGSFRREEAERLMTLWQEEQAGLGAEATGTRLRWVTSTHLAAGYAALAWGDSSRARAEFTAVTGFADRLETWPQFLSNLGIATMVAGLLAHDADEHAAAARLLEDAERMYPRGVAPLRIWNFHMFEELRAALHVWQRCFVLKKILEREEAAHILPRGSKVALSEVSLTVRRLVERGLVRDVVVAAPG